MCSSHSQSNLKKGRGVVMLDLLKYSAGGPYLASSYMSCGLASGSLIVSDFGRRGLRSSSSIPSGEV